MQRAKELTFLAFCLCLIAASTLPGCKRKVPPAPEPDPKPAVVNLIAETDALESRLEARLRWDAAKMLENGATLKEARDFLKSKWPNAQFEASEKLRAAERDTIKEPADAIQLWRQWAIEADPSLKDEA